MIQRQKDGFTIECDACGEADDVGSFSAAWTLFRKLGWAARKNGDVWTHACPKCVEKAEESLRGVRRMFGETK